MEKITITKDGHNRTVVFDFGPNDYFTNTSLKKEIYMKNEEEPSHSVGTQIEWKDKKKNVTVKTIQKKQKNKKTGQTRTIEKEEK